MNAKIAREALQIRMADRRAGGSVGSRGSRSEEEP